MGRIHKNDKCLSNQYNSHTNGAKLKIPHFLETGISQKNAPFGKDFQASKSLPNGADFWGGRIFGAMMKVLKHLQEVLKTLANAQLYAYFIMLPTARVF